MKQRMILTTVLLLSALLAMPVLAAPPEGKGPQQLPEQAADRAKEVTEAAPEAYESEAFKRQQEYIEQREAMKARRDEALKIREQNVNSNNPGNTGL
jgi:hypothetical protein